MPSRSGTMPNSVRANARFRGTREVALKLTGERPMEGATPDSLLALHDAGYREVCERLGTGVVLDVGCGIGSETERLAGANRLVIGADHSSETVRLATRTYGSGSGGSAGAA